MKHLIQQVGDDDLYLEVERYGNQNNFHFKLIRQYNSSEPEVKFEAFLSEKSLNNFITGLQKASLFQKELFPLEPDPTKNYGNH